MDGASGMTYYTKESAGMLHPNTIEHLKHFLFGPSWRVIELDYAHARLSAERIG